MSGKGSISRMSDECLMKQETVFSFYTQYQAVMRKFTLAGKAKTGGFQRSLFQKLLFTWFYHQIFFFYQDTITSGIFDTVFT